MRIISKFHDYYDAAMGHGIDTEKIWMRKEEVLPLKFPLKYRDSHYLHGSERDGIPHFFMEKHNNSLGPYIGSFLILLAGKLYPGVEVRTSYLDTPQKFYTVEPFIRFLVKNDLKGLLVGYKRRVEKDTIQDINDFFALHGSEMLRDFAINHRISIATDYSNLLDHGTQSRILTVNPQLSRLQFQKCLDPTTVYQELEMWVGGVLTEPETPTPVPDIQKVVNQGFDPKTSFRKGKEVK